jgi:RND superfamily putative drug exporter
VLCSVFFGLTFLPALLGMMGPRVNALSVRGLLRRLRPSSSVATPSVSRWERVARAVMARPWAVLTPVLAGLLVAGSPVLHLEQAVPDAAGFPPGLPSRNTYMEIRAEFPAGETSPIAVLVDLDAPATELASIEAVMALTDRITALDGVGGVEGPFTIQNPQTGEPLTAAQLTLLFSLPTTQQPPGLAALLDTYVRDGTVRINALSPLSPTRAEGAAVAQRIRDVERPAGVTSVMVGGLAGLSHDFLLSQNERMPFAVGTTLLASALILFLLFGSLVLPIKAVIVTLLSISASFGALVWIFQDGNLADLLAFEPLGYTTAGNPIIMFCVIFGLSMDYEVLLLSRIQEAWRRTGDNTASVAEGLARTAAVITGAALIMVSVFAAFALAEVLTIKSIGVGLAIAVLLDATVVRVFLVPATMRLLGRWNWWAPGPLGRFADRLGFSHVEDGPS